MVVLVFYGGAGVNIIFYCCNECQSEGLNALKNNKCCDIHHHPHDNPVAHNAISGCCDDRCNHHDPEDLSDTEHAYSCICDLHTCNDLCSLERIDFDWNFNHSSNFEEDLFPDAFTFIPDNLFYFPSHPFVLPVEGLTSSPHGPPIVLPQDYLSTLTVLLI